MYGNFEIELSFSDITMVETDGVFKEVQKIMLSEFPFEKKWALKTNLTISSKFGVSEMLLNCFNSGHVYIIEYKASIGDVFYNPDIQAISTWAQDNGWKIPQPHENLARANKEFWKHFYDTLILDCDYFDKVYGKRSQLENTED